MCTFVIRSIVIPNNTCEMSNFKRKAQPFFLGLLLGIVIAGTFFILRLDTYFKELNFYKNFAKTFLDQQSTATQKEQEHTPVPAKLKNKKQAEQFVSNEPPEKSTLPQGDSVTRQDSVMKSGNIADQIVVRKDELLNVRTVELLNLSPPVVKTHRDSLLEKVSEIRDNRSIPGKQSMQIEFWKSPLNYKGYKLSKYNVILYGLKDTQNLKLFTLDDIFYMKHASVIYKLDYNADFKPFERVVDETILHNFK